MNQFTRLVRRVAITLVLAAVGTAAAGILVDWTTPPVPPNAPKFYQHDGVSLLPDASLFLAFWSPDLTIGFNPTAPGSPTGGDVFLGARSTHGPVAPPIPFNGQIVGYGAGDYFVESSYSLPPDAFVGGYVYIVFFEFPFSSYTTPSSIPLGTFYGIAPVVPYGPLSDADPSNAPPPPPQVVDYGPGTFIASYVIPEPATALITLVGAASAIWIRRRRREKGAE